ncbi:SAM hydrolase/SAM-dependent halogenase family protein [Natrialbaceae archaeon AArc-T1-2]|uniref:SAM hydrolase/SAM-dependent halogenase family protein n=1 Tax=Natrialbaceae archaeon AArc-T1-2 TaxID=3053904 RepID=UPI00255B0F16|nr:SAM-dependent chlorinase/fluorinase [Natrialbaceae archaeon AArc-T1-2]WIV68121.1 SAM-dependent chlorinase/fluorinase [Natrialbaceae archaeon AArc-T1-2]
MITLASDFGSPYPAAMKGVLLERTDARLVDVAHDFPRQDVRAAAFWLRETLPYFPPATHLVVVDPGVGTDRDALVVRAGQCTLVGPDNGVLRPVARELAGDGALEYFRIDDDHDDLVPVRLGNATAAKSTTFHGRDVFAPAAAIVHETDRESLAARAVLSPTDDVVDLVLPEATVADDRATGEVLVVDDFGNVVTNVPGTSLEGRDAVRANDERVPVERTFAAVDPGERLATVGSHGYVELDVNRGRGEEAFGLEPGDVVVLELESESG